MNVLRTLFLIPVLLCPLSVKAHPVSYQDGVGLMSYNTHKMNELLLTYSFSPKFAVAHTYLRQDKSEFHIPRLNFLLRRWNLDGSQGNIYLSAGSGIEKFNNQNLNASLGEVVLDWESRKYYTYLEHRYIKRSNITNTTLPQEHLNNTKVRLGFAPFLADYSDLNIWLIAQGERQNNGPFEAKQFVRLFMRNILLEVGAGFDGSIAFNYMIHI